MKVIKIFLKIYTIIFTIFIVLTYLCISFYNLDFNLLNLSKIDRGVVIFIFISEIFLTFPLAAAIELELKKY